MIELGPIDNFPCDPRIVIEEVQREASAIENLSNFSIDLPKSGDKRQGFLLEIAGWIVGRESPVQEVIVRNSFTKFASIPISVTRNDVSEVFAAQNYPALCGFNAVLPVTGLPHEFHLNLFANSETEKNLKFGQIIGRRAPVPLSIDWNYNGLQPLIVTCLGRTGSSWLMHLLLRHPDIAGPRLWPYELLGISYWLRTFRFILEHPHGLNLPSAFVGHPESWWGGGNPFGQAGLQNWYGNDFVLKVADFCRDGIQSVYNKIAKNHDQPFAKYFVEKVFPNSELGLLRELFPASREIILVRDFRDMVASILSFNRKRGFQAFDQNRTKTEEEYPALVKFKAMSLVEAARGNPNALVVKYENLVTEPTSTMATILAHLGLSQDDAITEKMVRKALEPTPKMEYHKTSSIVKNSVGKWRSELSEPVKAACNEAFKEALAEFNYL